MQPLTGLLVVDLALFLPGPLASRELLRLGARVVRLEPPGGDPLRELAPAWHDGLNAGKESVVCDLKADPELGRRLCARADVVLTAFRPGVAERLGVGPDDVPARAVYCRLTGFGPDSGRAGHDLNYLGDAGVLADTAPAMPPLPFADVAAGGLTATIRILAALLERGRSGRGARITVSLAHEAHALAAHRLGGEPTGKLLTGGLATYGIYATADGRHLTVTPIEERFFRRLCELLERPDLVRLHGQLDEHGRLGAELERVFAGRSLADWLELFDGEDVCVGPVASLAEAAETLGAPPAGSRAAALGEHTEAWSAEVAL